MADDEIIDPKKAKESGPGTDDTTEYAPSKAPKTREHAEERSPDAVHDPRLTPGSAMGTPSDVGMSGLDRATVPNGAAAPEQTDYGQLDISSTLTGD
jgi:hypothetical protein